MWYRIGDKVYGVLCDWDLAEVQATSNPHHEPPWDPVASSAAAHTDGNAKPEESAVKPRYRTGTGPFMAMDLLRPGLPPLHLYRYDLESLFYILACVCVTLDLQRKAFRRLPDWERESLLDIGRSKREFLRGSIEQYTSFFTNCDPAFRPLVDEQDDSTDNWVFQLWFAFGEIESLYDTIIDERKRTRAPVRHRAMRKEGEEVQQRGAEYWEQRREEVIDYAQFMGILGMAEDVSA